MILARRPTNLWSILKSGAPGHPKRFTVGSTPARTRGGSSSTPTPRRRETNETSSDSARDGTTPRASGELYPGVGRIAPSRPFPRDTDQEEAQHLSEVGTGRKQPAGTFGSLQVIGYTKHSPGVTILKRSNRRLKTMESTSFAASVGSLNILQVPSSVRQHINEKVKGAAS